MRSIPRYTGLKSNNLKKLNNHSFLGNPLYQWLSGHFKNFLVLFAQNSIVNCLKCLKVKIAFDTTKKRDAQNYMSTPLSGILYPYGYVIWIQSIRFFVTESNS